ncbi:MAG: orotidine-5'-phosphate decarboxylase [Defluviitaleaceae bacterium]|nr:orotidine-5'-phosphate decarboxylase [Defluviitaleaceae bacterium]MCL2835486.1 orotidine-5'-phosphate decarboxylase [Defluviitaleaceae bacterium]
MAFAIDRLIERIKELRSPVCVGLDPSTDLLPESLLRRYAADVPGAFLEFNKCIIDAVYGIVPVVKPQIAFYERYGIAGISAYLETVSYAKSRGLLVIGDIKRGDIGSTAAAYADAHLGEDGPDFVTINPYLGRDAVEPFINACQKNGKGLFVLVVTSNPGGADLQNLELQKGGRLYEHVGGLVSEWGKDLVGTKGYSSVCAVVGATAPAQAKKLRMSMPQTFFLIPGYGAQGGTAADAAVCFNKDGIGGIVNSSRGIIAAWKKPEYAEKYGKDAGCYADCARSEAIKMIEDLRGHIGGLND